MGFEELWVLPDGFQRVCRRTEEGERFTKDLLKYIEKRSKIEATYSKTLLAANGEIFRQEQEIGTLKTVWESLKAETETIAKTHEELSVKLAELANELKSAHMEERKNRALIVAKGGKLIKDLAVVDTAMKKARANFVDLKKQQDKAVQALQRAKETGDEKKQQAAQKEVEKAENKAEKADNEYRITVNTLKAAQDQFYDKDLPALLREFEQFEITRTEANKAFFDKLVTLHGPLGPNTREATERLRKHVTAISAKQDNDLFVSMQDAKKAEPPARASYVPYDSANPDAPLSSPHEGGGSHPHTEEKKKGGIGGLLSGIGLKKGSKGQKEEKEKKDAEPTTPKSSGPAKIETSGPRFKAATRETKEDDKPPVSPAKPENAASPRAESPSTQPKVDVRVEVVRAEPPKAEAAPAGSVASNNAEEKVLVALYDYEATEDTEISFAEGEKIVLLEQDESGWWTGRNAKGQVGVFPSNFVEAPGAAAGKTAAAAPGTAIPINADYKALYDYEAEDETELTIKEGETLHVETETDGWYFGSNSEGKKGNFPSNFVEKI